METGRVVEWHIAEGSRIEEGQPLVSIETDKTVVEVESPISVWCCASWGKLMASTTSEKRWAWIGEEGEAVPDAPAAAPKTQTAGPPAESRATPVGAATRATAQHRRRIANRYRTGWSGDQRGCAGALSTRVMLRRQRSRTRSQPPLPPRVPELRPPIDLRGRVSLPSHSGLRTAQHRRRIASRYGTGRTSDQGGCPTRY